MVVNPRVGDKVKALVHNPDCAPIKLGEVVTVTKLTKTKKFYVRSERFDEEWACRPESYEKVSDVPIELSSTGKKFDSNKAPIGLIPAEFIEGMATIFAFGAKKYGKDNYREGIDHSRLLDAAMRHCLAILRGEELDPESGLPHRYHMGCSLAMYDYMVLHHPERNDIFELNKKKE